MKYILSLVVVVLLFIVSSQLTWDATRNKPISWIVGISVGVVSIVFVSKIMKIIRKRSFKELTADSVSAIKSNVEDISSLVYSKDTSLFAIAEKEIDTGNIDEGLWSLALIKSKGDEKLRKVEYIKLRVKQLRKDIK